MSANDGVDRGGSGRKVEPCGQLDTRGTNARDYILTFSLFTEHLVSLHSTFIIFLFSLKC